MGLLGMLGSLAGGLLGGGGGGGFLSGLAKTGMNMISGIAGNLFKPLTSLVKPIGNVLSKWSGADFARE